MDLVAGAMGNLAPKLLQLLQDEYKLQKGLRDEVKSLAQELESTHVALCKVAQVPPDQLDPQVKLWARDVREASYDMEDVLDTFLVRVDGGGDDHTDKGKFERLREKMGMLFSLSKLKARHDIARAIKDIKKQIQEVTERRDRCKVNEIVAKPPPGSTIDPRLEAMYKEVSQLVGIGGAMDELISMLSLHRDDEVSNAKLKIVSVLGIGGLGKTTIAKAVYDKLKTDFSCGAFVPVGRNPDLKKVFRDILIDLDKDKYSDASMLIWDERQLLNEIRDFLSCKRYFIIIDDVWEAQSWERIRLALVESNNCSRIISTTRKFEVTRSGVVYKPKPLSDDNSKRLFYTRIFDGEDKFLDNQVDEVSDKILKKCGGIPLAIITMASLLVGKSRGEWFEVCNSIGFRDKDIEQVDITMRILSLSYYDLPSHLRTCLLYLSAFPEDYIIDKNSLIWRWIAEDFVHKKPNIGLFGVGEGYFNDLVNRSMIQAVESQCKGIIDGCRVHDMVFDLLRSLSREENFFTVLLDNDEGTSSVNTARRFSHRKNTLDPHLDNHNNKGMQKMRSFVAYSCHDDKELSFQSFKLLRVLDLEDVYMKSWHNAKHLGNLLHLRYLGLKRTSMLELPKEIGTLKFLQTLDLVKNYGIVELPSSLGQLSQLVCLRVWGKYHWKMSIPGGMIKKLTSLEELVVQCNEDRDKDYEGQFKELGSLSELRVLTIKVIEMTQRMFSDLLQSIGNLHKMQSLKIERHDYSYGLQNATFDAVALPQHLRHLLVGVHCFSRFPSCINPSSLINLSHLEIKVNDMDEQSMQLLARLPELRHLELSTKSKSKVTVSNKATDSCFQKLRICRFYSSVVLFVLNEDLSVSFTLWMGMGETILFGSTKKNESRRPPSAFMPNLQELLFKIDCFSMRKCAGHYGNLGLEYLISLKEVTVFVDCYHCSSEAEVMEAEAGLRHAVGVHPNHPALSLKRHNERRWTYKMK